MDVQSTCVWQFNSGRDNEGDKFNTWVLHHRASGMILSTVNCPSAPDDYRYRVYLYCKVPKDVLGDEDEYFNFVSAEFAKRFVDNLFYKFEPHVLTLLEHMEVR